MKASTAKSNRRDCPDPNCPGRLWKSGKDDVCDKCHRRVPSVDGVSSERTETETTCPVEGCPGTLDANGGCARCKRRAAWKAEHGGAVIPDCEVCGGKAGKGAKKYCPACRPIAQQVHARAYANALKKRGAK